MLKKIVNLFLLIVLVLGIVGCSIINKEKVKSENKEKIKSFAGYWEYISSTNDEIGDGTSIRDDSGRHILYVDEDKTNLDWAWDSSINFTDGKQLMLIKYGRYHSKIVCFERENDYLIQHKCSNELKEYVKKLHPNETLNELDDYNIKYKRIS